MPNPYKIGDILMCHWGYEQTNVDFYKVIGITEKSIRLIEITKSLIENDSNKMTGKVIPNHEICFSNARPFTRRVDNKYNIIRMNSYSFLRPWDGSPKEVSFYG